MRAKTIPIDRASKPSHFFPRIEFRPSQTQTHTTFRRLGKPRKMAEAGTLIAIIQLADRVIELSKYWIEGVRDAESDLRSILIETSMLKSVLENIQFLTDCSDGLSQTLAGLSASKGPLGHCRRILDEISNLIPAKVVDVAQQSASPKDKMKLMVARLGWAARRSTALKLLDELQRHKAAISLALITESVQDIKEIKIKTNQVLRALSDAERREFCQWYQQTNPSPLHNRAQAQFEQGTCEWIRRLPEWHDWLDKKYRCLWIHGIPGAGKTILASSLVRQLEASCESQPESVALYYYCYFANNQNEAAPFLRWITTELCREASSIPNSAYKVFNQDREPSLPELLTALAEITEPFGTIYIVVDALDESKPRDDLLKVVRDLVTDARFDKIQVVATSREYIDIEMVLEDISKPVSMSNPFITQDIALCVRSALQNGPSFRRWSKELLDEVEATLAARAKGMFRWVICQLDRLRKLKGGATAVRKALITLPRTLDETYQRIFAEIPEEERDIVRLCLGWIDAHALLHDRSMPVAILLQVLNSRKGALEYERDSEFRLNQEDLREICGCLINITTGQGFEIRGDVQDKIGDRPVVSFAHYTVREFLSVENATPRHSAMYFMLEEDLWLEIAASFLTTALNYDSSQLRECLHMEDIFYDRPWQIESEETTCIRRAASATFTHMLGSVEAYCVICAVALLNRLPEWASSPNSVLNQRDLVTLALRILDPSQPHVGQITGLLAWWFEILVIPRSGTGPPVLDLWRLNWITKHSSAVHNSMWLFTVMAGTNSLCFLRLAKDLLNQPPFNLAEALESPVQFEVSNRYSEPHRTPDRFDTSFMEFIASRPRPQLFYRAFALLLNRPGIPSSVDQATALLHAHSIAHRHDFDKGPGCAFKALLDLGASPHGRNGYATTPIQRAVGTMDWDGVEMLLEAGADINDVGNPGGVRAGYDYHHFYTLGPDAESEIDSWVAKSPLLICYHESSFHNRKQAHYDRSFSRERRLRVLDLLILHGAKALKLEDGEIVEYPEVKIKLTREYDDLLERSVQLQDGDPDKPTMFQ